MRIHQREMPAQRASLRFRTGFDELIDETEEFSVLFQALNVLESCVIKCMTNEAPPIAWPSKEASPKYAFEAGQLLCAIVKENELTHGEILSALRDAQLSFGKILIRIERHPGKPDMPGGLEDEDEPPRKGARP